MGRTKALAYTPVYTPYTAPKKEKVTKIKSQYVRKRQPSLLMCKVAHLYEASRAPRKPFWKSVVKNCLSTVQSWHDETHKSTYTSRADKWVIRNLTPTQCIKVMLHAFKCWFLVDDDHWKNNFGYNKNWSWWYLIIDNKEKETKMDCLSKNNDSVDEEFLQHIRDSVENACDMRISTRGTIPQMQDRGFAGFPIHQLADAIIDTITKDTV